MDLLGSTLPMEYWAILRRRRFVVYLSIGTVVLVALIGSLLAVPQYRATATLQIERQNPDILSFKDLARTDYSWAAYTDFYQTQYKILASEAVARKAVDALQLTRHPSFAPAESKSTLRGLTRWFRAEGSRSEPPSPELVAARRLQGGLTVSPVRSSHLVEISWVSPDPQLCASVANAVASAYIQFSMGLQYDASGSAGEFLGDQIGKLKEEIQTIEEALQSYGEAKRIVSIDDASNITLRALTDVSQRRTAAQTELARAEAAYRAAAASPPEALPEVQRSTLIERLRGQYDQYEAEYSEGAKQFKDEWPAMQNLAAKMEQARQRLALEISAIASQVIIAAQSEYTRAKREVENLDRLVVDQETAAQLLRRDSVEFTNLQTEVQKKRQTLDALLGRQNELALATRLKDIQATSSNIRIVDHARPPEGPFRPNKKVNLLLGLALGSLLGVAAAFTLEYLDHTVHSAAEISTLVDIPTLAVVPRHGPGAAPLSRARRAPVPGEPLDLVAHLDGRARVSEAYRELRTALLLSSAGRPPRQILVTSALPEEGKSATAVNLAIVLAQLGRRVLLVDTDLRRPRLHAIFGCGRDRGVSTFLSGLADDPLPLALPTGVEHLELIASGPVPPNPSELLNSKTFVAFGNHFLEQHYDHVVYDSPPVLAVSDAVIIGSVVDAVVLVARAERTPRQSLRLAVERLTQAGVRPVGVVLNDVDMATHGRGYWNDYGPYDQAEGAPVAARPRNRRAGGSRASG